MAIPLSALTLDELVNLNTAIVQELAQRAKKSEKLAYNLEEFYTVSGSDEETYDSDDDVVMYSHTVSKLDQPLLTERHIPSIVEQLPTTYDYDHEDEHGRPLLPPVYSKWELAEIELELDLELERYFASDPRRSPTSNLKSGKETYETYPSYYEPYPIELTEQLPTTYDYDHEDERGYPVPPPVYSKWERAEIELKLDQELEDYFACDPRRLQPTITA